MAAPVAILNLPLEEEGKGSSGTQTIGGYLGQLLLTLLDEVDNFSGKRPFGTSGWKTELQIPMIKAGFLDGEIDEYGYLVWVDWTTSDRLLTEAVQYLFLANK